MRAPYPQSSIVTRWAPSQMMQSRIATRTALRTNEQTTGAAASVLPPSSRHVVSRNVPSRDSRLARTTLDLRASMNDVIARY